MISAFQWYWLGLVPLVIGIMCVASVKVPDDLIIRLGADARILVPIVGWLLIIFSMLYLGFGFLARAFI